MKLLKSATLSVADLKDACARYADWLDDRECERGALPEALALAWSSPESAGAPYSVLAPASGREIYLRLIENPPHHDYEPLRTFGWNAIEVCVQDVEAVAERMADSPFEIIGPPREIDGLPAIYPMQVKGPDKEIVYFTQIRDDLPAFDLPRASALIDSLFILVMGCSDLDGSLDWLAEHAGLAVGRRHMEIVYTMLAKAYDLPEQDPHVIATMVHGRDVFLELDQYPPAAVVRPRHGRRLPQGVALGSFAHPDFDELMEASAEHLVTPPQPHESIVYGGRRAATLLAPDDTLVELIEA